MSEGLSRLRILHVIRGLANSSGTTHIVNPLAEAQARAGCDVTVLYVRRKEASVEADAKLVRTRCFELSLPFANPGFSRGLAKALPDEVAAHDVVHVHAIWNFPSWWAMRTARRLGRTCVVAPQGSLDPWALKNGSRLRRLYARLTEWPLMRQVQMFQALTAKESAQIRDCGLNNRIGILPNGVVPESFCKSGFGRLADSLQLPVGSMTILFLSRLHPKKGVDLLMRAFAEIAGSFPLAFLVIAGSDGGSGYLAVVMGLARELGIVERCRFIGEVSGVGKIGTLSGADIYVLASRSEGLPVAALEAMASGLPCVLSTECNLPEAVEANAAIVVNPEVAEVRSALHELLEDPPRRAQLGLNARALVRSRFSWKQVAADSIVMYREAMNLNE